MRDRLFDIAFIAAAIGLFLLLVNLTRSVPSATTTAPVIREHIMSDGVRCYMAEIPLSINCLVVRGVQ